MDCKELKEHLVNKTLDLSYLIFVYKDNTFLVNQYIEEIAKQKNLIINYIDDVTYIPNQNSFTSTDTELYVFYCDEFKEDISNLFNTIIVCKQTIHNDNVVIFPTLVDWQVLDYMKIKCNGLTDEDLVWIYNICNGDIFKIDCELKKINIFPTVLQRSVFNSLQEEGNYIDLNPTTIYQFVNAIIKKDKPTIQHVLTNLDILDIEGTGLVTVLRNNIKNIISIQFNPKATAEDLHLKENQFRAIKYNVGKFSNTQLINILQFLTSIDYRLKSGLLQMSNDELVSYIVCNMF